MSYRSLLRPHPPSMLHTFDAFRHRSFRLLWAANFFGYISRWMQMTLLAKVEELTLYTIAQDKTITGQEQALIALAATIQELAVRLAVVEQSVSPD